MPTYLYRCSDCEIDFEKQQGINSKPMAKCPNCKKQITHRLITKIGGIIFKGDGWPGKEIAKNENS